MRRREAMERRKRTEIGWRGGVGSNRVGTRKEERGEGGTRRRGGRGERGGKEEEEKEVN